MSPGTKTQTDVPSRIQFLWATAQIEQEIASLVRLLFTQRTDCIIVRIVIIVLCCQHVWFHVSFVLTDCFKLAIWCVTEIQKTDSAFIRQVVCRCWSYLHCLVICENNSEVRRVLTVLVPTVHPQMNSELDSWWLAHGAIRHRHMTNSTMDFSGTPDNGFD